MHNAAIGVTMEFKYNAEGIRTQKVKKVNGVVEETTNYTLNGKKIVSLTNNDDTLYFTYDASGAPATVTYIGGVYTYVKNLQGDIVGILDVAGNLVVEYKYDAWGNQTYISGILHTLLGKANPFRYRGYAYDEETGLYYLRSRYYNPELGKFVNADKNIGEKNYLLKHNIYCYCENDPIGRLDLFGNSSVYITVFIKYDKLADQIKNEDFGHAELKCGDYSYSYGRYREVYGQYGITGDGILVIDDYNKSVGENKEKGRKIYRYELNVSEEEVSAIEAYIENTIANIEPEKKKAKYYHIDTYHLLFNNCTTFTIDILVYACGDRVPERLKGVNTPSALYYVLENLYNNNDPFIKSREVLN